MTPAPSNTCYITYAPSEAGPRLKLHFSDERGSHSVLIRPDDVGMQTLVRVLQERARVRSPKIGTAAAPTQAMLEAFGSALSRDVEARMAIKNAAKIDRSHDAMEFLQSLGL